MTELFKKRARARCIAQEKMVKRKKMKRRKKMQISCTATLSHHLSTNNHPVYFIPLAKMI